MREILFRGKSKGKPEWEYGYLYKEDSQSFIITSGRHYPDINKEQAILGFSEWFEVIPETVGQFTGLLDKHGRMIFEGDILCANSGRKWDNRILIKYLQYALVVYNPQKARFEISGKIGQSHKALDQVTNNYNATVVGNIYDNPDWMKES